MAAPVRNHAIAAPRSVSVPPIADDRVIGNAGRDRDFIDGYNETVIGGQGVDAIREPLQLQSRRIRHQALAGDLADRNQLARRFHQPRSDPANPVACQFTAAMRRGHENYAADFWSMLENERLFEEVLAFRRQLRSLGRFSKSLQP